MLELDDLETYPVVKRNRPRQYDYRASNRASLEPFVHEECREQTDCEGGTRYDQNVCEAAAERGHKIGRGQRSRVVLQRQALGNQSRADKVCAFEAQEDARHKWVGNHDREQSNGWGKQRIGNSGPLRG